MEINENDYRKVLYLAALETIRLNRYMPYKDFVDKIGSVDTSSETLRGKRFDNKYIYVITGISAFCTPTSTPQIKIGFESTGKFWVLESATVANAEDNISWTGELILREGEYVRADFENVSTTGDTIQLVITGYMVKLGV